MLCHALLSGAHSDDLVCALCRHRWRAVVPPWCERGGQPEPWFGACRICPDWPPALERVRSAVWLDPAARRAVHALKYGGLPRIAEDLAAVMARVHHVARTPACLVPIPLGPRRLAMRGYNQSEWLARCLARRWGIPVAHLLRRVRDTATQTALTPAARLANVAGAFAPVSRQRVEAGVLERTVILVDDVFTTGATLAAAARALGDVGARFVQAVTFGRATIPDFT